MICVTEQRMGHQGAIRGHDIEKSGEGNDQSKETYRIFNPVGSKVTVCTPYSESISSLPATNPSK